MSVVGIIDPESCFVWNGVDESVDPSEDQCPTAVFACFDDVDPGLKYSIDGSRHSGDRTIVLGWGMTGFGDFDRVLADEILQPSGTTHPWREFCLEWLTFDLIPNSIVVTIS